MNDFFRNPSFFSIGGVVGRLGYLLSGIKMALFTVLAFVPFTAGGDYGREGALFGALSSFLALTPVIFFGFHSVLKRIRDIRGTTENEIPAIVTTFILLAIPYFGLVPFLCLFLVEGAITGRGNILSRLEESLHSQGVYAEDSELTIIYPSTNSKRREAATDKKAS